jgi:hypothetical protein
MKWITLERPKIDRIACPWRIQRFIEKNAEFPSDQVFIVTYTQFSSNTRFS